MDAFIKEVQFIYDKLADDVSREIFVNRLAYSLTGHIESIRRVIKSTPNGKEFLDRLDEAISAERKICIFGSGIWGKNILESNPDVKFSYFIDNNADRCGREIGGVPVIHFDEWIKMDEPMTVIISTRLFCNEIYSQLKEHQVPDELIINAGQMVEDANKDQYFDLPKLKNHLIDDEVFVDVGAFDGQTSVNFVQWEGRCRKIFAMEPDPQNIEKCVKALDAIGAEYEMLPFGAWNKQEQLSFSAGLNGGSHVGDNQLGTDEKQIIIDVAKIDDLIQEKVSFIKMDIEGAEINALKGAESTIKTYKPKLAICVYHKKEDIWEIPKLILSYVPEYKLYLRHYSLAKGETVLYCVKA